MCRKCVYFVILLCLCTAFLAAWEIDTFFHIGNLSFAKDRSSATTTFAGTAYPWGLRIAGSQRVSDNMALELGYYHDPIINHTAYTLFSYEEDFFEIGVGPFFGVFNTTETLMKPGITTHVKLELPGIVYIAFRTDSSINGRIVQKGDYFQEKSLISLGYYVPNAICTLYLETKNYVSMTTATTEVVDKLTVYGFRVNLFKKNVPYKLDLGISYQDLSKSYLVTGEDTVVHTLASIMVETGLNIDMADGIAFLTNMETSMYTFGRDALTGVNNPGPNGFLFRLTTGFRINPDQLFRRRRVSTF